MKIVFRQYFYAENLDFKRIIREAGFAHEVDADKAEELIWYQGISREIEVKFEWDTDTGIIKVVS